MVKTTKLVMLPTQIQQLVAKKWWGPLMDSGVAATYKKGSYFIRVGERDRYIRMGLAGWTALQRKNTILMIASTWMQTNAVGLDPVSATADLVTLTEVPAILLDREIFTEALMDSPPIGLLTVLKWSQRHLDMIVNFSAIKSSCPLDVGLAALLWILGTATDSGRKKVPIGIPQLALARMLGTSREEINRKWKVLANTGYLTKDGDDEYLDAMTPMLLAPYGF
jgi:hypothetical protein